MITPMAMMSIRAVTKMKATAARRGGLPSNGGLGGAPMSGGVSSGSESGLTAMMRFPPPTG